MGPGIVYDLSQKVNHLTHLPLVPHICVSEYDQYWFKIMACRLFGAKLLAKSILAYCQFDPREQTSVKFQLKYIHENASEYIVCEKAAILSRRRWVKCRSRIHRILLLLLVAPQAVEMTTKLAPWPLWVQSKEYGPKLVAECWQM